MTPLHQAAQMALDALEPLSAYGRVGTSDVDQAALQQVCAALRAALAQPACDYPECSGEPTSCPENEGYGCCKAQPAPAVPDDMVALIQRVRDAAHWQLIEGNGDDETHRALYAAADALERLSAAPAVWEPLTDEQIDKILERERMKWATSPPTYEFAASFARAIEAAHGITGGKP